MKIYRKLFLVAFVFVFNFYIASLSSVFASTVWQWQSPSQNVSEVLQLNNIIAVSTGRDHSIALTEDGTVWAWGKNDLGQLGNGTINNSNNPTQVIGNGGHGIFDDVISISAGGSYSLALKKDGTVWIWGANFNGARGTGLGNSDPSNILTSPTQVKGINGESVLNDIKKISAGGNHSLALRQDGSLIVWGVNNFGNLGIGCNSGNCSIIKNPVLNQNINSISSIAAGDAHSIVLKTDGTIWGWGSSQQGQLGITHVGNQLNPVQIAGLTGIKTISAKHSYNIVIDSGNKIFQWGGATVNGTYAEVKEVTGLQNISKISAGRTLTGYIGLALTSDGKVWEWDMENRNVQEIQNLVNISDIAAGFFVPNLAVKIVISPTPSIISAPEPFLELPWDYKGQGKSFEGVALDPNSWFDHKYPLQNVFCCVTKVLKYVGGEEKNDYYRSHSGYDYGSRNGVFMHTPVLAAAGGIATFTPEHRSSGAGNMIKIDHGNGYQTWYEHLSLNGLVVNSEGNQVQVEKGQQIGKVGMSGNTNGPHIHFSVFKDENENGTFSDDYPYGLVDPLGWEGENTDPWTEYTNSNGTKHGAKSYNLFLSRAAPVLNSISASGGNLTTEKINVLVPDGASSVPFTLTFKDGPFESNSASLRSATPSFYLTAFNNIGDKITQFLQPVTIKYSYKDANLLNIKEDTLKLYHYNKSTKSWDELPSTLDKTNKTVTGHTTSFSQFAVMGELKDTLSPDTQVELNGTMGWENWYRSPVTITLDGKDNEGGVGLEYTLFKLDDNEWVIYNTELNVESEGKHKLTFESIDKAYNLEDKKSVNFTIDKTVPVTMASVSGTEGLEGWFTSDVAVRLTSEDNGEVDKMEYSLDGGSTFAEYNERFTLSEEGISEILYRSVDKAGNVEESKSLFVKIDKTSPSSLVYTTGAFGKNDWYTSDIKFALNAQDADSGYNKTYYSLDNENFVEYIEPLNINDEGTTKIYYYSLDKAGNKEIKKTFVVKIDKNAPEAEILYDIPSLDIKIKGTDNLASSLSTSSIYNGTSGEIKIEDAAGNILKLVVKDKEKGKNARLSVVSLQYNNDDVLVIDKNTFSVKFDFFDVTTNTVKKFDQDWKVNDISKLTLSYSNENDMTTVKNRLVDDTISSTQVSGKKFLKITTIKGNLSSSY